MHEAGLEPAQGETLYINLVASVLTVRRSSWKGVIGTPKGGRERKVPLTGRLNAALKAVRHLRSAQVRLQESWASGDRLAHAPAHLPLAPRHEGRGAEGNSGAGGAQHAHDDAQVHALGPSALTEAIRLLDFGQPAGSAAQTVG